MAELRDLLLPLLRHAIHTATPTPGTACIHQVIPANPRARACRPAMHAMVELLGLLLPLLRLAIMQLFPPPALPMSTRSCPQPPCACGCRPAMHAMVELLGLLLPLLRRLDAPLAAHLEGAGLGEGPPIFALAWLLTWFAHGVPALPAAARLFDAFLASHPLLPLYAAAAAMKARAGPPTWLLSDVDRLVLKYVWKSVVPYCAGQKGAVDFGWQLLGVQRRGAQSLAYLRTIFQDLDAVEWHRTSPP